MLLPNYSQQLSFTIMSNYTILSHSNRIMEIRKNMAFYLIFIGTLVINIMSVGIFIITYILIMFIV